MMKSLCTVFLVLLIKQTTANVGRVNPLVFQCALSIQVYPLEYTFITRSMSLRVRFSSNCLRLRDFVFESFFTFKNRLSKKKHPKLVELNIFGNKFRLSFGSQKLADENSILRKYQYTIATLSPSKRPSAKNVSVDVYNKFLLDEQKLGSFGIRKLSALLYKPNPIRCKLSKRNDKMSCYLR